jgi:hypothetical protein
MEVNRFVIFIMGTFHTLYVLQGDVLLTFGGDVQLDQIKPLAMKALERLP